MYFSNKIPTPCQTSMVFSLSSSFVSCMLIYPNRLFLWAMKRAADIAAYGLWLRPVAAPDYLERLLYIK